MHSGESVNWEEWTSWYRFPWSHSTLYPHGKVIFSSCSTGIWLFITTIQPVNNCVWWYGAVLWPATTCSAGLVKVLPHCKESNTGEHAGPAREASDDDLLCPCWLCRMSVDASVACWRSPFYQLGANHLELQAAEHCEIIHIWLQVHRHNDCGWVDWGSAV